MAENKDKVKLEDTFSADEAAVKTTSENKEEKAAVREEVLGKVEADLATYKIRQMKQSPNWQLQFLNI